MFFVIAYGKERRGRSSTPAVTHSLGASLPTSQHHQGQVIKLSEFCPQHTGSDLNTWQMWTFSHCYWKGSSEITWKKLVPVLQLLGHNESLSESFTCLAESFWQNSTLLNWTHDRRMLVLLFFFFASSRAFLKTYAFFQSFSQRLKFITANWFSCFFPEASTFLDSFNNIYYWCFCIDIKSDSILDYAFLKNVLSIHLLFL